MQSNTTRTSPREALQVQPPVRDSLLALSMVRRDHVLETSSHFLRNPQPMSKEELVAILDEALTITAFEDSDDDFSLPFMEEQ